MSLFSRYIGFDYSGAATPITSLKGIRVYQADLIIPPTEILPSFSKSQYWCRKALAEWLADLLQDGIPTLVGIDHCFSFPKAYFDQHDLSDNWPAFLEDFHQHWPTDRSDCRVEDIRRGLIGNGEARSGSSHWRRETEIRAHAKSPFHYDVPGSVAKSSHAGLPWLRFLRNLLGKSVHFWPFDGWQIPKAKSVILEAYPSLWSRNFPVEDRTPDQHDAFTLAASLKKLDQIDLLETLFQPDLTTEELKQAKIEGWIFGVL